MDLVVAVRTGGEDEQTRAGERRRHEETSRPPTEPETCTRCPAPRSRFPRFSCLSLSFISPSPARPERGFSSQVCFLLFFCLPQLCCTKKEEEATSTFPQIFDWQKERTQISDGSSYTSHPLAENFPRRRARRRRRKTSITTDTPQQSAGAEKDTKTYADLL